MRYATSRDHRFRTGPAGRLPGPGRNDCPGPRPLGDRREPEALRRQDRGRRGGEGPPGVRRRPQGGERTDPGQGPGGPMVGGDRRVSLLPDPERRLA